MLHLVAPMVALALMGPVVRPAVRPRAACVQLSDAAPHCTVIFLRHGQSEWNEASLFTGWANVELTTLGKNEAARAATQLWREGYKIDVAYTSLLKRAQQTLNIVLSITGQEGVPVHQNWRLNERMYGALTGLDKKETADKYGPEQVKIWRRSFDTRPPDIDTSSKYWPGNDNEYAHINENEIPLAECLKDTVERTLPYWDRSIVPALQRGKTVLVAAHGNSIRGMLKALDEISNEEIVGIEIPTGVPLVYQLDEKLRPIKNPKAVGPLSGVFLGDADEVAQAQQQVAEQSKVRYGEKETMDSEMQFLCIGSGCLMLSDGDLEAAFAHVDKNGNGLISANELKAACDFLADDDAKEDSLVSMSEVDEMIRMVDRNGDGQIDFEEYLQAMTAQKQPA